MGKKDLGKTTTGMEANVEGLLCYLVSWITGLIFFLVEKENKFVRFHALQSMIAFGALTVLSFIPLVGLLAIIAWPILWIFLMIKAYQGEKFKLPLVGDLAEKNS